MSKIKAKIDHNDYGRDFDFLNFEVEGFWLNEKIDELYPGKNFKNLVPTLTYWMNVEEERELIWKRILPAEGEKTICPILMCPDHCDFSCTTLVAEIENWGSVILWNRIGINTTPANLPENIGIQVNWLHKIGELEFEKEDYIEMINLFKIQYEKDSDLEK